MRCHLLLFNVSSVQVFLFLFFPDLVFVQENQMKTKNRNMEQRTKTIRDLVLSYKSYENEEQEHGTKNTNTNN